MGWIDQDDLKAIHAQADIVDVISSYIPVEKSGKDYKAVCPFHDDHNPSLSISSSKQIYKCFTCGNGGNVFTFVSRFEKISFPEAVAKVADLIHYPLKRTASLPVKEDPFAREHALMESYLQYGHYELFSADGTAALAYLHDRKLSDSLIRTFQLGYAPASEKSLHYLHSKKFDPALLTSLGLVRSTAEREKAVFENRILIPIHDFSGKPVGFSARRLNEQEEPKYINTAQSPLYTKHQLIFNYHRALPAARKARRLILCEGAMDVIGLAKAGIEEAVACLGTALSDEQLSALKAVRVPITVFYDADSAGNNAAYKFGLKAAPAGLPFTIVNNTLGKDPDEVFNEKGKDELRALCSRTISWAEFLFHWLPQIYNLENYDDLKTFSRQMKAAIDPVADPYEKNALLQRLEKVTGFDFSAENQKTNVKNSRRQQRNRPLQHPKKGLDQAEECALYLMLCSKSFALRFQETIGFFQNEARSNLSFYIYEFYRSNDQLDLDWLMASIEEEEIRSLLAYLMMNPYSLDPSNSALFVQILDKIKICSLESRIASITQEQQAISHPLERVKKAMEKKALIEQLHQVRNQKEG